jgi:hypothetical protein
MVQAPGRRHIGGSAYFVWADPPKGGGTARRPVAGQRRPPSAWQTAKPLRRKGSVTNHCADTYHARQ